MPSFFKRELPLTVTSVIIISVFAEYFIILPKPISSMISQLQSWTVILAAFALVLGVLNVIKIHGPKVLKQSRNLSDRILSAWILVIMIITTVTGVTTGIQSKQYQFIFLNIFSPLSVTLWSIMAFYYCGAIYKSLRSRSLESFALFIAAFLVTTRNTPVISAIIPWWENLGTWIMDVPAVAGMRGMVIGVGIGSVAMAIRMILWMEKRSVTGEM